MKHGGAIGCWQSKTKGDRGATFKQKEAATLIGSSPSCTDEVAEVAEEEEEVEEVEELVAFNLQEVLNRFTSFVFIR